MDAVLLTHHGGFDALSFRSDVPEPTPGPGEVLIEVGAAGINNTDINTRTGWYSKSVTTATNEGGAEGFGDTKADGGWAGSALSLPRIQGADACGRIVAVGDGVDASRVGERVLVRPMQSPLDPVEAAANPFACITFGSEVDGGFAQLAVARSVETYTIDSDWSDVELASIPCAYSTAENMLHRASIGAERVLITGASGGVGSAAVQLAKRRGAEVIAVCGRSKAEAVAALGADQVVDRPTEGADTITKAVEQGSVDVVVDLTAGAAFGGLLDTLVVGGRYVTAGAIAGPIVDLDVRTLYLRDLTMFGATQQPPEVFANLISYIEAGEISPVIAGTYPLSDIVAAQKAFLAKDFVGKLVLIP